MYKPLLELEETNTNSRIQLTKALALYHKVRTVGGPGEQTQDKCRGLALFLAFDPWETSLRYPPDSARLFELARKIGLIAAEDAAELSQMLIRHGAGMARVYNGVYSSFFSSPKIRTIFSNVDDLQHLSESGLAIGGAWVDRLFESSPVPLQPSRHLEVQSFRQITLDGEIDFYSQTPWLAWIEALDLVCLGTWAGLAPADIIKVVKALEQRVVRVSSDDIQLNNSVLGRKVVLPMFSRGLQGAVVGTFVDVPKDQMEPILTSLTQFGETLSDVYADLRWRHFVDVIDNDLNEEELGREVINVVSPIAKLIVSREGRRAGYKIAYEHNYWVGYEPLRKEELNAERLRHGFSVAMPGGEIYIEPLADIPHINPEFTRIRIENFLNQTLGSAPAVQTANPLAFADIRRLRLEFEEYAQDGRVSIAKLRQLYVIQKIEKFWHKASVKISNSEMKGFLESRGRDAKNGYQVTSFTSELDRIFSGKVVAAKTRNALSLTWKKGVSPAGDSRNT